MIKSNKPTTTAAAATATTMKFLCSYGGKILPRYPDGKLRYQGGHTRVLSVPRSVSFSELMVKLGVLCGGTMEVTLRCQLPTEDLDALVSITSDEDLLSLIEEYDRVTASPWSNLKIRAFLSPPKSVKNVSAPPLTNSTSSSGGSVSKSPMLPVNNCYRRISSPPLPLPIRLEKSCPNHHRQYYTPVYGYATHIYLARNV